MLTRQPTPRNTDEQAIELLNAVLFAGMSSDPPTPALMPPATLLRLLTTLMVHPYYTSQSRKGVAPSTAPHDAYICMRRIIEIIGPTNADVGAVWVFNHGGRAERRRAKKEHSPVSSGDNLSGELANEESLFSRVEDLWGVVGWAFMCSTQHPARWTWWRNLLDCLLLALERDWVQRVQSYDEGGHRFDSVLRESMIVKLLPDTQGTGGYRRMIRAILATGTGSGANEFHMVWDDELLPRRPKSKTLGNLGGLMAKYDDDDDDNDDFNRKKPGEGAKKTTKKKKQVVKKPVEEDEDSDSVEDEDIQMEDAEDIGEASIGREWGGIQAIQLRTRFLSLIADVSTREQYTSAPTLYHEYAQYILPFSLESFKLFVSPFIVAPAGHRCTLAQFVLEACLSANAPPAKKEDNWGINQEVMVRRFLPYPANSPSVVDNAKVAILLETLLNLLLRSEMLYWNQELEDAAEAGIAAREEKASFDHRGHKHKAEDMEAVKLHWKVAEEGIRTIVKMAKLLTSIDTVSSEPVIW
ncbi:hypothetical protein FN846DRAFT_949470 [Sphaerosporella brunnea]|uniref:Uncharacterized protein n=1 Tax=Sphaerosporella brunnea TaxID=1250544 RepID=A0A5J5EX40_9PEZI|nr:hypothetical protein FN846DRAFT_949470 [Sphaerosporella brunnea]